MNNFLRTIIAGYGAKKLGGGCLSTIIVFIVIYYALGTCNSHPTQTQTRPASISQPSHTRLVALNPVRIIPFSKVQGGTFNLMMK